MTQLKNIKISAFTRGDILGASSRLRSFYLFSESEKFSLLVDRPKEYSQANQSDVIHIQKIYSWHTLKWIIKFRLQKKQVIFDICDQINRRSEFPRVLLIALFSSVMTVDNQSRKNYWHKIFPFKKIVVIPDVADTKDVYIQNIPYQQKSDTNSFFWIGNSSNFKSIKKFSDFVQANSEYKLAVAMDIKDKNLLSKNYPHITFYNWHPEVAFESDINAKFMVLNHAIDKNSSIKSENKMVLALIAGYIPIVSNTPAYVNLAKKIGAEFLIFNNLDEVPKIAELATQVIQPDIFFDNAKKVINENYSREAVLSQFKELVLNDH